MSDGHQQGCPAQMHSSSREIHLPFRALALLAAFAALLLPPSALGGPLPPRGTKHPAKSIGTLMQLPGGRGCVVDSSAPQRECRSVRALQGPAPLLGSRAIALSPDGKNLYVASSGSDAIAVFVRNPSTGVLTQGKGIAGCIAAKGADGCATAVGLDGPNSVAVSPDGLNVYATSVKSETVTSFRRNPKTGALSQRLDGSGCIAGTPLPLLHGVAGRCSAPTSSSSAPTARTSTSAPSSATRSRSSTVTPPAAP